MLVRQNTYCKWIALCCLCITGTQALAEPQIAGLSTPSGLVHGASATITGQGFGAKSPAAPLVWASLDTNLQASTLGRVRTWWTAPRTQIGSIGGLPAAIWNMGNDTGWPAIQDSNGFQIELASPPRRLYLRAKHYMGFDPVANGPMNHKLWRAVSYADSLGINWYSNWHHTSGGDGRVSVENVPNNAGGWNDAPYPHSQWNTEEWIYQNSDAGVANGTLKHFINRKEMNKKPDGSTAFNSSTVLTNLGGSQPGIRIFGVYDDLANVPQTIPAPNWPMGYRDVYYDDTWARVEICNTPTYNLTTVCEVQIPTAWADNSISVVLNRGIFPDLRGAYLYVADTNGNMNPNGHPLCTTCPKSVTNLR